MTRVRTAKGSLYFKLLGASFFLIELLFYNSSACFVYDTLGKLQNLFIKKHLGTLRALDISLFPVSSSWDLLFTVVSLVALIYTLSGFIANNDAFQNYIPLLFTSCLSFIDFWIRLHNS